MNWNLKIVKYHRVFQLYLIIERVISISGDDQWAVCMCMCALIYPLNSFTNSHLSNFRIFNALFNKASVCRTLIQNIANRKRIDVHHNMKLQNYLRKTKKTAATTSELWPCILFRVLFKRNIPPRHLCWQ